MGESNVSGVRGRSFMGVRVAPPQVCPKCKVLSSIFEKVMPKVYVCSQCMDELLAEAARRAREEFNKGDIDGANR